MMDSPVSLLIVDDEPAVRNALGEFLRDFKYQVTAVESAEAALEIIPKSHFEIIIVDLMLPGLDGENLILKAHAIAPQAKFLIHTGLTNYILSHHLIGIGMEPFQIFLKPILNISLFLNTIQKLIEKKSAEMPAIQKALP